jgi:hypothetical protein
MAEFKIGLQEFSVGMHGQKEIRVAKTIHGVGEVKAFNKGGVIFRNGRFIKYDDLSAPVTDALVKYFVSFQEYSTELQNIFERLKSTHVKSFKIFIYSDSVKYLEAAVKFETRVGVSYKVANKFIQTTLHGLGYRISAKSDLSIVYVSKLHQEFKDMPAHKKMMHNITRLI